MSIANRKPLWSWGVARLATVGYVLMTMLLIVSSMIAFWSVWFVGDIFVEYRATARSTNAVHDMLDDVSEARLAALAFRYSSAPAKAQAVDARLSSLIAAAPEVVERGFLDAERTRIVGDVARLAQEYAEAFDRARTLLDEKRAALAALAAAAEDLEARERTLTPGQSVALNRLLTMHRAVFDTELRDAALGEAARRLSNELGGLKAGDAAMREAMRAYDAALAAAVASALEIRELQAGVMDVVGPRMQSLLNEVVEFKVAKQDQLGPKAASLLVKAKIGVVATAIIAIIVGVAIAMISSWRMRYSLGGITAKMESLAQGDLTVEIYGTDRRNELGRMARALATFKENATEVREAAERERAAQADVMRAKDAMAALVAAGVRGDFSARAAETFRDDGLTALVDDANRLMASVQNGLRETQTVLEAVSRRDLSVRMDGAFEGAFADLQRDMNGTIDMLAEVLRELSAVCADVDVAAQEIASSASDVSSKLESQAASLEETSATMEEMNAAVANSASGAKQAKALADQAAQRARRGREIAEEADAAMREIEEGSERITAIIGSIDSIAFTTNLLALNASVEAARAGEAGKGFAVVASEVRNLAQRAAQSAGEIRALIEASSVKVGDGVNRVQGARDALVEIAGGVDELNQAMDAIAVAASEQASGVSEVTSSVGLMDQITQSNAAMAEESAANAGELATQAARLQALADSFTLSRTRKRGLAA